jgi:phage terminase large subunit
MEYQRTTATNKLEALTKRIRAIAGGTAASKTISILLILIDYAQTHQDEIISVVSESFPHLKRGAIRDFINIMTTQEYFVDERWNKSDYIYTFETGSKIEFFSADQVGKVRGPRRDVLFINEANNIGTSDEEGYNIYSMLEVRTRKIIWLDWNPSNEFWFYTRVLPENKDIVDFLTLTYRDNEALEKSIIDSIESRRANKNWYAVYGLGQLGVLENRIYKDWEIIDEVPHEARLSKYGLDFGYTNDPTACDAIFDYNGGIVVDEIFHEFGLSNRAIADLLLALPRSLVVADSAEPKSIDELKSYGLRIVPSVKGADSVRQGIQYIQDQKIFITKKSINTIKEYRNYLWMTDKDGKIINEPEEGFDHHMDDIRYALTSGKSILWKPNEPGGILPFIPGTLA